MTRTALILSPHFPPSTLAGVHRARHLARHLPAHGWRPVIVRADPAHYTEPGDPALAALVPATVQQVRTNAWAAHIARRFGIGDIGIRGYPYFAQALRRAAATYQPSVVLITGSPFIPMLLGRMVRRSLKLPLVLDFQDPWVTSNGAKHPFFSKARMAHRLACWFEPRVVENASFITSVSDRQNQELADRHPVIDRQRMAAIPIGGDPDDYIALNRLGANASPSTSARAVVSYVGTMWPAALGTVKILFSSIRLFLNRRPDLARSLQVRFIGTSRNPDSSDGHWVRPIAKEFGLDDIVTEKPERIPYLEALAAQVQSDLILILGSQEPHYTASKIFGVLMSGRPYLSIFHKDSSTHEILSRSGGGISLGFADRLFLENLQPKIAEVIESVVSGRFFPTAADPAIYEPYTANAAAARYAEIFNLLASEAVAPLSSPWVNRLR